MIALATIRPYGATSDRRCKGWMADVQGGAFAYVRRGVPRPRAASSWWAMHRRTSVTGRASAVVIGP